MFLNFFRSILSPRLHAEGTCRETMFMLNNIHDVLCHSLFDALFFFGGFGFSGLRPSFLTFSFSIYWLAHRQIYGKRCESQNPFTASRMSKCWCSERLPLAKSRRYLVF